jgi:hypothetical protein
MSIISGGENNITDFHNGTCICDPVFTIPHAPCEESVCLVYLLFNIIVGGVIFLAASFSLYFWYSRSINGSHDTKLRNVALGSLAFIAMGSLERFVEHLLNLLVVHRPDLAQNIMYWIPISFETTASVLFIMFWSMITSHIHAVNHDAIFTHTVTNSFLITNILGFLVLYSLVIVESAIGISMLNYQHISQGTTLLIILVLFAIFGSKLHFEGKRATRSIAEGSSSTKYTLITTITAFVIIMQFVSMLIHVFFSYFGHQEHGEDVNTRLFITKCIEFLNQGLIIFIYITHDSIRQENEWFQLS